MFAGVPVNLGEIAQSCKQLISPPCPPSPPKAEPLAVSPAEAARLAGLGWTTIYAALGSGALKSLKIGTRRLIALDALRSWLLSHEVAP
jgi:excisionase family DNA binding protein